MDIRKFFKSFIFAFHGIIYVIKSEQNFRFHLLSAVIVVIASTATGLSKYEWIIIIMLICGMFMIELVNASIERVVDLTSPDFHQLALHAKDLAAGACLVYAICCAIVGLIIFVPKWWGIIF
ncbi:diacylglycerol kinase family protein [Psychrobacillus vulpis]|uniref:Diacylglycerol kinase family protein n=1 Tax=Psychrobacillus vulpis TaxID=2325572 RepID=A0A544TPA0_9BACI|nr:diacylglycerol kinase family protein [Psychrobacillus vulpis]TQR19287.1 diacylglycerol kinase family protein [Psychrobacillus vulpis]